MVAADQYKIGVVDAMAVLEQSPQAEQMATELRIEFENRNRQIIELQKEVTDLNERLTNTAREGSQAETDRLERELYLKNRELTRMENEYKEDLSDRRNQILAALQDEIVEAIEAVSEQNQFDIVLTGGVNWAGPRVNMTPLVVEYLKNKLKK
jgi:outer membrane protein